MDPVDNVMALDDCESFFFLYNCLWSKSVNPDVKRSHINIPDVIIFQEGKPFRWLFTSDVEGDVMKKKNDKLKMVPVIVKAFKTRSAMLRNGQLNNNPGKIATLWINGLDGIECALLSEQQLYTLLYSVFTDEKETPILYEVLAVQVYFGGHTTSSSSSSSTGSGGSGIHEHRCYSRKHPDSGKIMSGQLHESFEHTRHDRRGRPVLSTYSHEVDRIEVPVSQHNILSSVSSVLIEIIERSKKVKVRNIVIQVAFTANWIPLLIAVKSILLTNIDQEYLSSLSKKHKLIYPIESVPSRKEIFNLKELIPKALFENDTENAQESPGNTNFLSDLKEQHHSHATRLYEQDTASASAHHLHLYGSGHYSDGKFHPQNYHHPGVHAGVSKTENTSSYKSNSNDNNSNNHSNNNAGANESMNNFNAAFNQIGQKFSDHRVDDNGIPKIDRNKPPSGIDYQQNDLSDSYYKQEMIQNNTFKAGKGGFGKHKKTVSLFEKLKMSVKNSANGSNDMTCRAVIDHHNVMTESTRGHYSKGIYDRENVTLAEFKHNIGLGEMLKMRQNSSGSDASHGKRPISALLHHNGFHTTSSSNSLEKGGGNNSSQSRSRHLGSEERDLGRDGENYGNGNENSSDAIHSGNGIKHWFTSIEHHCNGDFCNIGMTCKPTSGGSSSKRPPYQTTGLQANDSMATISKSGYLNDDEYNEGSKVDKATRNLNYLKPYKSILLAKTEVAYVGKDIDDDTDGLWRTRALAKEVDQIIIFYTKRQILRVLRKCSNDSLLNPNPKGNNDSVKGIISATYQRLVYSQALSEVKPSVFYGTARLCGICYQLYTSLDQFRELMITKNIKINAPLKRLLPKGERAVLERTNMVGFDLNQDDNPQPVRPSSAPLCRDDNDGSNNNDNNDNNDNNNNNNNHHHHHHHHHHNHIEESNNMNNSLTFSVDKNVTTDYFVKNSEGGAYEDDEDGNYEEDVDAFGAPDDQLNNTNIAIIYDVKGEITSNFEPPLVQTQCERGKMVMQGSGTLLLKTPSVGGRPSDLEAFFNVQNAKALLSPSKLLTHNLPTGNVLGSANHNNLINKSILRSSTTSANSVFSDINKGQGLNSGKTLSAWLGMFKEANSEVQLEVHKSKGMRAYKDPRIKFSKTSSSTSLAANGDRYVDRNIDGSDKATDELAMGARVQSAGAIRRAIEYTTDEERPTKQFEKPKDKQRPKSSNGSLRAKTFEIKKSVPRDYTKGSRKSEKPEEDNDNCDEREASFSPKRETRFVDIYTKTNKVLLRKIEVKPVVKKEWDNRFFVGENQSQERKRPSSASAASSRCMSGNSSNKATRFGHQELMIAPPEILEQHHYQEQFRRYYEDNPDELNLPLCITDFNEQAHFSSYLASPDISKVDNRIDAQQPAQRAPKVPPLAAPWVNVNGRDRDRPPVTDGIASLKSSIDADNRQIMAGSIEESAFAFLVGAPMLPLEESLSYIQEEEQSNNIAIASIENENSVELAINSNENLYINDENEHENSDPTNSNDAVDNTVDGNKNIICDTKTGVSVIQDFGEVLSSTVPVDGCNTISYETQTDVSGNLDNSKIFLLKEPSLPNEIKKEMSEIAIETAPIVAEDKFVLPSASKSISRINNVVDVSSPAPNASNTVNGMAVTTAGDVIGVGLVRAVSPILTRSFIEEGKLRACSPTLVISKAKKADNSSEALKSHKQPVMVSRYSNVNEDVDDCNYSADYEADFELSVDNDESKIDAAMSKSEGKIETKIKYDGFCADTISVLALANKHYYSGHFDKSLAVLEEHLENIKGSAYVGDVKKKYFPSDQIKVLLHIGHVHETKANWGRVEDLYGEALVISNAAYGIDSLHSADVLISFGNLYRPIDIAKARGYYTQGFAQLQAISKLSLSKDINGSGGGESKLFSDSLKIAHMKALVGMAYMNRDRGVFASFSLNLEELKLNIEGLSTASYIAYPETEIDFAIGVRAHYLNLSSQYCLFTGCFSEASEALKQALSICDVHEVKNSLIFATLLDTQSEISRALCNISEAIKLSEQAFTTKQKLFGKSHPALADSFERKSSMLVDCGDFNGAIESIQNAMTIRVQFFGEKHFMIYKTLVLLSKIHDTRGFPQLADSCFKDANSLFEGIERSSKSFSDIMELNDVMASNLLHRGCAIDAIEGFESLVSMAEKVQDSISGGSGNNGSVIPKLLVSKLDLCLAYLIYGDVDKAEPIISFCTKLTKEVYGEGHWYFAKCMHVLGEYCSMKGNYVESDKCLSRAMGILVKIYDKRPTPLSIECLISASQNSRRLGSYDNAIHLANLAVTLITSSCGDNSIYEARALQSIAECLRDEDKLEEAEEVFSTADEIFMSIGADNLYYATFTGAMGALFRTEDRLEDAIKCLKNALQLQKKHLSFHSTVICETLCELSQCLLASGEVDRAMASFEAEVIPYSKDALGGDHPMALYIAGLHAAYARDIPNATIEDATTLLGRVNAALICFKDCSLSDTHPWVLALGGYS